MSASGKVGEFLAHWQRSAHPAAFTLPEKLPNGEYPTLGFDSVAAVLDELMELREQLSGRIAPANKTDTVVHSVDPPMDFGLLPGTPVRFFTGPDKHEYVQVHTGADDGWVHVTAWPHLRVRPVDSSTVRVQPGYWTKGAP